MAAPLIGQQGLDPAKLLEKPTDTWPMYHGDYSGRRFSTLTKINSSNVKSLSMAWFYRTGVGGIKATPLEINGVLYFSAPDHAWAVDARTGRELWHYAWESKGGIHIGNRGVGIYGNWLYFETPDCHLVSLNIQGGKERWRKTNCDLDQFYYGSVAPLIVKNHVIAGVSGDDLDRPGYVSSYDPETGDLQWRWYVVPQKMGDPGSETWPNEDAMKHGGGMTWQVPTYDPELNLLYVTTGNPQPVIAHKNREGANLFTASMVALNPDTGKMVWYFQTSPHDTHDWDATAGAGAVRRRDQRPEAEAAGDRRAQRLLLRPRPDQRQEHRDHAQYIPANWAKGIDKNGSPIPDPAKEPQLDGALVSPNATGATNWPPPTFSPQTGSVLRRRHALVQRVLHLRHRR